jgi:hypothetical protein
MVVIRGADGGRQAMADRREWLVLVFSGVHPPRGRRNMARRLIGKAGDLRLFEPLRARLATAVRLQPLPGWACQLWF